MILPLRQRHRRMFAVIGVLIPIAFVLGIAARRPVPAVTAVPEELTGSSRPFASPTWERSDLFMKRAIGARLLRESGNTGRLAVELSAANDFVKPDLLVYWADGKANLADALPDNAILLGAFSSSPLRLPQKATRSEGLLVLYSLADSEIVDVSKPIRFNVSTR